VEKLSLEAGIPQPGQSAPFSRARTDRPGVWLGDVASLGQWQFTPTLRMDHQWLTPLDGSNDSNHSWHLSPSLATSYRFVSAPRSAPVFRTIRSSHLTSSFLHRGFSYDYATT
jgi:iron complex outermembrane receptor protein